MRNIVLIISCLLITNYTVAQNAPFDISGGGLSVKFDFFKNNILKNRLLIPEDYSGDINLRKVCKEGDIEVAIHMTGEDRDSHVGSKMVGSMPGMALEFDSKKEENIQGGKKYVITLMSHDKKVRVESVYEFYDNTNTVRRYSRITNLGKAPIGIDYLSSAMVNNIGNLGLGFLEDKLTFYRAYNGWKSEARWFEMTASEMGYGSNGQYQMNAAAINNTGSMSSIQELPMGVVINKAANLAWFWQVEHNGSWHWEFSDVRDGGLSRFKPNQTSTYMYIGGPDEDNHNAWKELKNGETYTSVPVAVGCVEGGFNEAIASLTKYRRAACIAPHKDNQEVPVIFNDYMNCLLGNPTTEKELPLIEAAAQIGCDYYVIDAGWYAELNKPWWSEVGLWHPSKTRWTNGIVEIIDNIRQKGMIPGIWLEIERVGINSPLKDKPDSWFFMKHGKRVINHNSFHLDFRNPDVRKYADEIIDRIVKEYGVGYIKMDYNINIGIGTDINVESPGQGLLEHQRCYLDWLRKVYKKYPDLIIENCGSGGCRMDYAMLSVNQLQSSSDQTDYLKYPAILVGALAAVAPEQLAVWSYPQEDSDVNATAFNMVSAMMCRIHQSGHLANLRPESLEQVRKGIEVYKSQMSKLIPKALPYFPLGLPKITDRFSPVALGLNCEDVQFVAVWRLSGDATVSLPIGGEAEIIYPTDLGIKVESSNGRLNINFPKENMACIVKLKNR